MSSLKLLKESAKYLLNHFVFRWSFLVHGFYVIFSISLTVIFFPHQNDFLVYYNAGKLFLTDIENLYNPEKYLFPFRYLPLCAAFFAPYSFIPFELGFIVFDILNLVFIIVSSMLIYRIIKSFSETNRDLNRRRIFIYIAVYLMGLPMMFNYILGQINVFVSFFILISLYLFLTKNKLTFHLLGGILIGLSIILKPLTIFIIPFLFITKKSKKTQKLKILWKESFIRLFGVFLPVSLNLIVFLFYPGLLIGFIERNITGSDPLMVNASFSVTKIVSNILVFYFNLTGYQIYVFLITTTIIGGLAILAFYFRSYYEHPELYGFTLGILVMLLVYFDSWDHHLIIFIPLLILVILDLPGDSRIMKEFLKSALIFLSFFDLMFWGIWYFINPVFPLHYTTTVFLLVAFYGVIKQLIFNENSIKIEI